MHYTSSALLISLLLRSCGHSTRRLRTALLKVRSSAPLPTRATSSYSNPFTQRSTSFSSATAGLCGMPRQSTRASRRNSRSPARSRTISRRPPTSRRRSASTAPRLEYRSAFNRLLQLCIHTSYLNLRNVTSKRKKNSLLLAPHSLVSDNKLYFDRDASLQPNSFVVLTFPLRYTRLQTSSTCQSPSEED